MSLREFLLFLLGLIIGFSNFSVLFYVLSTRNCETQLSREVKGSDAKRDYDEVLADEMFDKVKVLCMVMTYPDNHRTKAIHVMNTWGRRCNKLLFMSSKPDYVLDTIVLEMNDTRNGLWTKSLLSFKYVYENHLNDFDWFLKADDDNYIVMENLRHLLYQYRPTTALYFGHRLSDDDIPQGYMSGGGYVLSKKALTKFVEMLLPSRRPQCHYTETFAEDWAVGRCLNRHAILVDCRDELKQKRFFPVGVDCHFTPQALEDYWYFKGSYYNASQGNLDCCSDTFIAMHYVEPPEMYFLEHLIYHVHPFGLEKNKTETFPRKLPLDEILAASNAESLAQSYQKIKQRSQTTRAYRLEDSERF